jgi:glycolate oxidase FAD binding subunit
MGRVLAGSLGTLGLLVDVSLKVLPRPVAERTLRFDIDEAGAIRQLNEWGGQPLPITASAWCDNLLWLRLAGARAAVDAAQARLGGSVVDDAGRWWADLREQRHPYFSTDAQRALWRLSVPPTTPPLGLGATLIEWHGGQRWLSGEVDATALRARVATAGGHATRFRGGDARIPAFHALDPVLARLNARLKAEFDPAGIFNPGRLSPL